MNKVFSFIKKIISVITSFVFIILLILSVYVTVCNINGKNANIFGYSIMRVVSGSMEPVLHVDDFILVKKCGPENIKADDIVTFYSTDNDIYMKPNTHRVLEVRDDGTFITKGDANEYKDSVVVESRYIIGKYKRKLKFFNWIFSFASAKKIMLLLVILPLLAMSFYEAIVVAKLSKDRLKEKNEKIMRLAIDEEKKKLYECGLPQNENEDGESNDS